MRILCFIAGLFALSHAAEWDYSNHGVDMWKTEFPVCAGDNQSPINVVEDDADYNEDLPVVLEGYSTPIQWDMNNNGHTIGGSVPAGNAGTYTTQAKDAYNGADFDWNLLQFHFHWDETNNYGSENTLNGKSYPLEIHFVHQNKKYDPSEITNHADGALVLGFFFEIGSSDNVAFDKIVQTIPMLTYSGNTTVSDLIAPSSLIGASVEANEFFHWRGSLTTPGCAEAVSWYLFKKPISISQAQMDAFRGSLFENEKGSTSKPMKLNWRPTQAVGSRTVYKNFDEDDEPKEPMPCGANAFTFSLFTVLASVILSYNH